MSFILSYIQVEQILQAQKENKNSVTTSLDLGITKDQVDLNKLGVILPDGQKLTWKNLQKICKHQNRCYLIKDSTIAPIVIYSEKTNWVRTLYPTQSAPTTLVSGILMHRIKDTNPLEDTQTKIKTLDSLQGAIVLDTATGLGYTAIEVSKYASKIITVELDPSAIEIANFNPYSQELFNNPKITQIVGDIREEVKKFESEYFTHIVHDPPTLKIAGELYSEEIYSDFYRVLKKSGKLFHYIGDPESEHGAMVTKGVIRRLKQVGFSKVELKPKTFGLLAFK